MVHFTCDLCGKSMADSSDPRFVVKIEAYPGFDPNQITETDLDDDHMEAVSQILQRNADLGCDDLLAPVQKMFRFDLCSCCHTKFLKDPLGKDFQRHFDFSNN